MKNRIPNPFILIYTLFSCCFFPVNVSGFGYGQVSDSSKGPSFSSVSINSTTEGYYSNFRLFGQKSPLTYVRNNTIVTLNQTKLPVSIGWNYFSQSNNLYPVNSFYVSSDFNKLRELKRKELINQLRLEQKGLINDSLYFKGQSFDLPHIEKEIGKISNDIELYQKTKYIRIDTSFLDTSFKHMTGAEASLAMYELRMKQLDHLTKLKIGMDVSARMDELALQRKTERLNGIRHLKKLYRKSSGFSKKDNLLLSIDKVGLGNIYPVYSNLILNGKMITGGEILVNTGSIYAGACLGKTWLFNGYNPLPAKDMESVFLKGIQFGIGDINRSHAGMVITESNSLRTKGNRNLVIGAQYHLNLNSNIMVESEYAVSKDKTLFSENSEPILSHTNRKSSEAWRTKIDSRWFKNKTRITATLTRVLPLYNSYGLFNLRKDSEKKEIKFSQKLYKNVLLANIAISTLHDNLLHTKSASSSNIIYCYTITYTPSKYPYLSISYNPAQMKTSNNGLFQRVNVESFLISSGYLKRYKKIWDNLGISLNQQFVRSTGSPDQTSLLMSVNNTLNFLNRYELSVSAAQYNHQIQADSLALKSGESFSLQGRYLRKKYSLSCGYTYSTDKEVSTLKKLSVGLDFFISSKILFGFHSEIILFSSNVFENSVTRNKLDATLRTSFKF
ncbi:MAG: hypothetical protein K1X81_01645 [Bacteroidia bacterium]|nr:hypothetical protein [Bacteroidia bacterium]